MGNGSENNIIRLRQSDLDYLDLEDFDALDFPGGIPRDFMGVTAWDYIEMAEEADSPAAAIRYAKKALELDPELMAAKLVLAMHKSKTPEDLQQSLEQMLAEEAENLARLGITEENSGGEYYMIFETRTYMRLNVTYLESLIVQGKYRKAIELGEKLCQLDSGDSLGVRYQLMALYATLEDDDRAEAMLESYPADNALMLLPLIALYYKLEEKETAEKYIHRLCSKSTGVKTAISLLKKLDPEDMDQIAASPFYQPYSKEEIILAYIDAPYLYGPIPGFLKWLEKQLPKKTSARGKRK